LLKTGAKFLVLWQTEQQEVGVRPQACPSATDNEYHPMKERVEFVAWYENMANQKHLVQDFFQSPFWFLEGWNMKSSV